MKTFHLSLSLKGIFLIIEGLGYRNIEERDTS